MKYAFLESHALFYPGYQDAGTGKSLVAEPGGVYDVLPEMPSDGRWAPAAAEPGPEPVTEVLPPVDLADTMRMPAVTDKKKGPGNGEPE